MSEPINNRYDFVLLFDVIDGNPNGDPDAGNLPRIDPETGQGLVTDVCLKRKVRNFVTLAKNGQAPYEIYVKERGILNRQHERAYQALGVTLDKDAKGRKGGEHVEQARQWMCKNFYDVRTFGAVMSTGVNAGQVRGPVQLTFGRSVGQVVPLEHAITRMAVATQEEADKQQGDNRTMGRKSTISYGLYRTYGFISPKLAEQTGFGEDDLNLLWEALWTMFDHDRSAARGMMSTRALIRFRHDSPLGNAPAHELLERVQVERKPDVQVARKFDDFEVRILRENLPTGVTIEEGRP